MAYARFSAALSSSLRAVAATCALTLGGLASLTLAVACNGGCVDTIYDWQISAAEGASIGAIDANDGALSLAGAVVVVGDGGVVLREGSDGAFAALTVDASVDLRAIAFDGGRGLIVGDGGAILFSDDDGLTWTPVAPITGLDLHDVVFPGDGSAVAVGDQVILRSIDGGASWIHVVDPVASLYTLRAVAGAPTSLTAVGDGGVILESVDGGLGWTEVASPVAVDLIAVDELGGLALARDGGVFLRDFGGAWVLALTIDGEPIGVARLGGFGELVVTREGRAYQLRDERDVGGTLSIAAESDPVSAASMRTLVTLADGAAAALGDAGARVDLAVLVETHDEPTQCPPPGVVEGRPFIVDGAARRAEVIASDAWASDLEVACAGLGADQRARLAAAWARDGAYEHASIASFARFLLELLALGAPAALVAEAQVALADEVRHAEGCFGIASAYAGRRLGPAALPIERALADAPTLASLAAATLLEGCVNETIAAVEAGVAAELAEAPAIRGLLREIAADEARHAALAWRTVRWALAEGGAPVREALRGALAEARRRPAVVDPSSDAWPEGHVRLSGAERARIAADVLGRLIEPEAARLLRPADRATAAVAAEDHSMRLISTTAV